MLGAVVPSLRKYQALHSDYQLQGLGTPRLFQCEYKLVKSAANIRLLFKSGKRRKLDANLLSTKGAGTWHEMSAQYLCTLIHCSNPLKSTYQITELLKRKQWERKLKFTSLKKKKSYLTQISTFNMGSMLWHTMGLPTWSPQQPIAFMIDALWITL